jgi:hypothetical protein
MILPKACPEILPCTCDYFLGTRHADEGAKLLAAM